jgi:hypothetical protein
MDLTAEAAAVDILELLSPSDAIVLLHSLTITQKTEAGDAEAEMLEILYKRVTGAPTSGSGGTTGSNPLMFGAPAAGSVVEMGNDTPLTGGTSVNLIREDFNVQIGHFHRPTPEERIILSPSQRLVVSMVAAAADALDLHASIIFEEIGG